jgi:hypothetical protein
MISLRRNTMLISVPLSMAAGYLQLHLGARGHDPTVSKLL